MNTRNVLMRVASRIPGVPHDLFDWWTDARVIATQAREQRIEDEARISTNPQDMTRWITRPQGRRKRPRVGGNQK